MPYSVLVVMRGRLVIASFKSKALRLFWTKNDASGVRPDMVERVRLILSVLDAATSLDDIAARPSLGFHPLKGAMRGRYSVWVNKNWRITFAWNDDGPSAVNVDLLDYH